MYDQFDGTHGKVPLAVQRREHVEMWMLLGDPGMQLPIVPQDISLNAFVSTNAGKTVAVSGFLPKRLAGATVRVTLERPAGSKPLDFEELPAASLDKRAT